MFDGTFSRWHQVIVQLTIIEWVGWWGTSVFSENTAVFSYHFLPKDLLTLGSCITRKPVPRVCDNGRLKPACSASELASLEISAIASRGILLSRERTKVLIRLRRLIFAFVVRIWQNRFSLDVAHTVIPGRKWDFCREESRSCPINCVQYNQLFHYRSDCSPTHGSYKLVLSISNA